MEYGDDLDRVLAGVGPEMAGEINAILCPEVSSNSSTTPPSTCPAQSQIPLHHHAVLQDLFRQIQALSSEALLQLNCPSPPVPLASGSASFSDQLAVAHEVTYKAVLRVLECLTEGIPLLELLLEVAAKALSHSAGNLSGAVRKLIGAIHAREGQKAATAFLGGLARENRTRDGLDVVDDGPLHEFETYPKVGNLSKALEGIEWEEAVQQTGMAYWVCPYCQRCTSDERAEHFQTKHPLLDLATALAEPVRPATKEYVVAEAERIARNKSKKDEGSSASYYPCIVAFTMETPVYRLLNRTSRELRKPGGESRFEPWKPFARLLHEELQSLPRFEGMAYRAIDFKPPSSWFPVGAVVTWNQVKSCSSTCPNPLAVLSSRMKRLPTPDLTH